MKVYVTKAQEVLLTLLAFGGEVDDHPTARAAVRFAGVKVRSADLPTFARAIRDAALLERTGALVADTNRMGEVVGWHLGN